LLTRIFFDPFTTPEGAFTVANFAGLFG